jgi:hypothetical protein
MSARAIKRTSGTSAANAPITVSDASPQARRFLYATIVYSATVTQTPTLRLNSALGAAFDAELGSIAITVTEGLIIPTHDEIMILGDDVFDVLAPAGGVGITASVAIYSELV